MPLTELIRYFNVADHAGESTLYAEGPRVAAWHKGLHLGSLFEPIVDVLRECIVGHQARLNARDAEGKPVDIEAIYARCETPAAVVHFDRLNRTLHALNFLAQRRYAGGYLQLAVHSRHLQAIQSQHGLVYEAILKRCGLGPADIVLEIDSSQSQDNPRLAAVLSNYRQRGYRLAIVESSEASESEALLKLQPDIIKLPLKNAAEVIAKATRAGVSTELVGINSGHDLALARLAGAELGQGSLFGLPQTDCRPTHSGRRVAYNSLSSSGADI